MSMGLLGARAFLVLTPNMFSISMPLLAAVPNLNSIPCAPYPAMNDRYAAAQDAARIHLTVSPLKDEKDVAVNVAARRFGDQMTDTVAVVDNGIIEGRIEDFQKILGWDGPSIRERIDELLPVWGIDPKDAWADLVGAENGGRMIRIRGEGVVPPEHFIQYSFFQQGLPPVAFLRRIYNDKAYRRLHLRFMRADLGTLRDLPRTINEIFRGVERFKAAFYLNWAKSLALGVEVGASQIIESGGAEDVSAIWNEQVTRFLDLLWPYLAGVHRVLSAETAEADVVDTNYLSLLTYLKSRGL